MRIRLKPAWGVTVGLVVGCAGVTPGPDGVGTTRRASSKRPSDLLAVKAPPSPLKPDAPPDVAGTSTLPLVASPSPVAGSPGPGTVLPSASPSQTVAPGSVASATLSPAPSVGPVPSPSQAPLPLPSLGIAGLKGQIEQRLGAIARLSFEQGQAGLVTNNAASVISNNGGALISDRGGGLLGNNAGAYRLAQGTAVIAVSPAPDEVITLRRNWDVGGQRLGFDRTGAAAGDYDRQVEVDANGAPIRQTIAVVESRHPASPVPAITRFERREFSPTGVERLFRIHRQHEDVNGQVERIVFGPEATRIRLPEVGVDLDIEAFELALGSATGSFRYRFRKTGSTETGTLSQVARDATGRLFYSYGDPLGYYAGESEVRDASGTLVVRKGREVAGSAVTRTYDLGDGLVMRLLRGERNVFRGPLNANGVKVADVGLGIFADGTTLFDLAYVDDPTQPRRVGWGVPPEAPPPSPPPARAWRVETVAGAAPGMAEGAAAMARFRSLRMLVAARTVTGRYFACDLANQRIVRLDQGAGGWTVATLAGDGTAGDADGPAASARFRGPLGLAIAADDTLYVSEIEGNRIRRIRSPHGAATVDTVAGAPDASRVDGPGSTARFRSPSGLALVGERLYVADHGNHALRAVDLASPAFTVSTLIGDGLPGSTDGGGAMARLSLPVGLGADADGRVWITESSAGRVRRYDPTGGLVTTVVAGVPEARGFLDGPAGDCGLFRPFGVFPDGARGTFVTHMDIRAIAADGRVRTIAGQKGQGSDDGSHDVASFVAIWGMVRMPDGSWLLTDSSRFRRLVPPPP